MDRIYIYKNHNGFDIYLTDYEKSKDECYCELCGEYDELLAACSTFQEFSIEMIKLFASSEGYTLSDEEELATKILGKLSKEDN